MFNPTSDLGYQHTQENFNLYVLTFGIQPNYRDISRFLQVLQFGMQW